MIEPLFALTYWRPWPTLIMSGRKDCENRGAPPPRAVLGKRVAVHAGKKYGLGAWPFDGAPPADVDCPIGIVGTVRVLGALDLRDREDPVVWIQRWGRVNGGPQIGMSNADRLLIDRLFGLEESPWWAGPVGILVEEPIKLPSPIACNGAQGWWYVSEPTASRIREHDEIKIGLRGEP